MNRNTPASHFDLAPQVGISRSRLDRSHNLKTSFNVGQLIPIYCEEVLPGDTFDVTSSKVARLQTLKTPVYDNLYLDTYFYFVPNRLVWEHFVNLCGENSESAWYPQTQYTCPVVKAPDGGWNIGTLADYFGIPTGVDNIEVNAMPFRAYALIVDQWFRDQNLQQPVNIPVNESTVTGSNGGDYVTDLIKGGLPFVACKLHDYFTSCLPAPQKGPDVMIPLVGSSDSIYPVFPQGSVNSYFDSTTTSSYPDKLAAGYPVYYDTFAHYSSEEGEPLPGIPQALYDYEEHPYGIRVNIGTDQRPFYPATHGSDGKPLSGLTSGEIADTYNINPITPVNLVAQVPAMAASINSLRMAFQIQRLYERDAHGTRYVEVLRNHFSVTSPDARLQRAEYLGGKRMPLNISQVTQLGATNEVSPLGDVAGMSVTSDVNHDFVKSFVEHGYIIGLAVARYEHTYQQGLARMWSRRGRFDWYWPVLANIGEQPVKVREIYCSGTDDDNLVFGYQEAWADYRYKPSYVTGEMRSAAPTSLDIWHFGDDYIAAPYLGSSWIQEDAANVDRTLAVTSAVSNQIFADFYFKNTATRPMPLYSVPGLIDHN